MDLTSVELRVLGCLLEKQRTTPDAYPLTLNALRLACNQSTNRDPVVDYDEPAIRDALERLGRRRFTRYASFSGSRASKYRQLIDEALGLGPAELALITVLLLRGPQTPGELKVRTERLHGFADLAALHAVLDQLAERELVVSCGRRPGQKEERWRQLLGEGDEQSAGGTDAPVARELRAVPDIAPAVRGDGAAVETLAAEVRELRAELRELAERVARIQDPVHS